MTTVNGIGTGAGGVVAQGHCAQVQSGVGQLVAQVADALAQGGDGGLLTGHGQLHAACADVDGQGQVAEMLR